MTRKMLSDAEWKKIEPLLPGKEGDCGVTAADNRLFMEAVLWIARTGSPWRDLPAELGNWHTTYTRFNRWGKKQVWHRVMVALSEEPDLQELMIDSTVIRAHQHAAGAKKKMGTKPSDIHVEASARKSILQWMQRASRSTASSAKAKRLTSPTPKP
jgi:putative transposase